LTGINNIAIGNNAGYYINGGSNTIIGYQAMLGVDGTSTSTNSVAIGYQAGLGMTTGGSNILLGYQAGDNLTIGGSNIVLGYAIDAPAVDSANTLTIGNLIFGNSIDGTGTSISSGNIGIGDNSPDARLEVLDTGEQLRLTYTDNTVDSRFSVDSTGDLTLDMLGGGTVEQLILADADVINIGGNSNVDVAYNIISDSATAGTAASDNDLFIEGILEVDTTIDLDGTFDLDSASATAATFGDGTYNYFTFDGSTDASDTLFTFTDASSGITSGSLATFLGDSITTGTGVGFSFDALTSGTGILIESAPGGATTLSGDLFRLNVGSNVTVTGDIFSIDDNGSELFTVNQTGITSALPHSFTAAGDVSMAYDLILTNQTSSKIESYGPLSIVAGEASESNNLTLKTYNSGNIVFEPGKAALFSGAVSFDTQATFTDSDATPDVSAGSHFITNTTTFTITDFDAGSGGLSTGHIVVVESAGAITYDVTAAGFNGGTTDIITAAGDITTWIYDGTDWNLIAFMDDSDNQITGADLAEWFVSTQSLEPGNVVSINPTQGVRIQKSTTDYDNQAIGIISTQPGLTLGEAEEDAYLVALAGRVPVIVDQNSPAITPGDYITSTAAGKAKKATKAGRVVGMALESWNPGETHNPLVFINPTWHDPNPVIAINGSGDVTLFNSSTDTKLALANDGSFDFTTSTETKFAVDNNGNAIVGNLDVATGENVCSEVITRNGTTMHKLVECDGTAADLAEWYPVRYTRDQTGQVPDAGGPAELPEPGDVVSIGDPLEGGSSLAFLVEKSNEAYDKKAIGVVSTKAHTIMGEDVLEWADSAVAVGLAGRVTVKINSASAAIEPGDLLSASNEPGRAIKAVDEGYTIGSALEAWDPTSPTDTILVLLGNSVNLATGDESSEVLASEVEQLNQLAADTTVTLDSIEALLGDVQADQDLLGQALSWKSDPDNNDINLDSIVSDNLFITGQAAIDSLSVTNSIVLGQDFSIQPGNIEAGLASSINSLSSPLEIQPTGSQPVSIMAGLVSIDTEGNMIVTGDLTVGGNLAAGDTTIDKLTVNSGFENASIGTAAIPAGESEITINTDQVKPGSLIYITPTTSTANKVLYEKGKITCDETINIEESSQECTTGFVIGMDGIVSIDIEFNWWIVDVNKQITITN